MNFWKRRNIKKAVHHLLHEARHARHMREDIVSPDKIRHLRECEDALTTAWEKNNLEQIDAAADTLSDAVHVVYPVHRHPRIRENIEILVVAISVAMAFRTFFIQPFRIPTGSMQPTLYGITYEGQKERGIMDRMPLSVIPFLLFGENYVEVKAKADGLVEFNQEYSDESFVVRVAGVPHLIHKDMPRNFEVGRTRVKKGDILASGRKKLGDHIFVNRMQYNFSKPKRGDIFVFSTKDIKHPDIRPDNYYIKRLVGMPGEDISIAPPYLLVNGEKVTSPKAFVRQAEGEGYHGYTLIGDSPVHAYLRRPTDVFHVPDGHYLPMGDNTRASLDGRFFGAVNQESVIGPAFVIYWPFTKRWGSIY